MKWKFFGKEVNLFSFLIMAAVIFVMTTPVFATVHEVIESDDWLAPISSLVADGDTIMFVTDGGSYMTPNSGYFPSKNLVMMAAPGLINKPVLSTNDPGYIGKVNGNLKISGLAFNGLHDENGDGGTYRILYLNKNIEKLVVEDCDFYNIRGRAITSKSTITDTIIVNNCSFWDINGSPLYFKDNPGLIKYVKVTNSSFWNANSHALYFSGAEDTVEVSSCSFLSIAGRGVYPLSCTNGLVIRDNIFMMCGTSGVKAYGTDPIVEYNCFWNDTTETYIESDDTTLTFPTGNIFANPWYEDTYGDDISLALALTSPCIGTASDGGDMGDTRWGTYDADAVTLWEIQANNNWINNIKDVLTEGDTVVFVTDGGSYMTPASGYIPSQELVLMAAPGLTNKPVLSTNDGGYVGKVNDNLTVIGLAFDGLYAENGDNSTYRMLYQNKPVDFVVLEDCDFYNMRGNAIVSKEPIIDNLVVNNCVFHDANNPPIYFKETSGLVNTATITNCSFWNLNNHAIYIVEGGGPLTVSNCTFYNIGQRGIYPKDHVNGTVIRDNIFMSCGVAGVKVYGLDPEVEFNCFWDNALDIDDADATNVSTAGCIYQDPMFEDTSAATFSLALHADSPCIGTASDGGNMGDPGWGIYDPASVTRWEIEESDDWITAIKDVVTDGDTVVFVTDGGSYMTPASGYIPSKELVLMAAPGLTNKPVLSTNDGGYIGKVNDNLTVIGLAFNGLYAENGDNSTYRLLYQNKPVDFLVVEDCDFYNMRGNAIVSKEPIVDNLVVNNCVFHDANNPPIYFKETSGLVNTATITNCSFWNLNNHAIYIVEGGGPLTVTNCTFYNVGQRGIYPKDHVNGTVIRDNIFMSCGVAGVKVYGSDPEVEFNCFWDNALDIDDADATNVSTVGNIYANPGFEDTSVDNFSLALNVMTSPCIGTASDGGNMGDPRWGITDPSAVTRWEVEAGTDWFVPIKEHLTAGDTISLTTDGGVYYSSVKFSFPAIPLVLMAKPGLSEKPVLKAAFNESRYKIYGPITIKGVRIEGDGIVENGIPYGIYFNDEADDFGTVVIEDCEFVGYRLRPIHMNDNNYTDTLIVNNCLFKEIGETGIYGKHDARNVGVARITNCTFYKVGQNNIRLNNVGDLEVSHCTFFYNDPTVSGRTSNIGIHAENDTMVVIRDNIFVNQAAEGVRVYGPSPTVEYNMFWECAENIVSEDDTTLTFPIFNFEDDPMFKDTSSATLDLAIVESCLGVGTASDGTNLGDPRWGTWSGSGGIAGDCNGDGVVDVLDVLGVVNHILGTAPLEGEGLVLADCNMDGEIDVLDALGIVNVILGTGTCPPAGAKAAFNSETLEFLKSLKTYLSPEDFAAFMALVKSAMNLPLEYSLAQNYPNPFNPVTTIDYALAKESPVKLVVYNVLGQKVKTLVNETQPIGYHAVRWDGRGEDGSEVSSGVYFYRLNAGSFTKTMKMMLLK